MKKTHIDPKSQIGPNFSRASLAHQGSFWTIWAKTGGTGTISTPPKSELAPMNSTLELFLNLALLRAK